MSRAITERTMLEKKVSEIDQLETELHRCDQAQLEGKIADVATLKDGIDRGLIDFNAVIEELSRVANTAEQRAKLKRYKTTQRDLRHQLLSAKRKLDENFTRNRLFGGRGGTAHVDGEEQALMREREDLNQSIGMTDEVIAAARANFEALSEDTKRFQGMSTKVNQLASVLPDVDSLIGKVGTEKRKERLVLGATFGICLVFLLWWQFLA